MCPPPHPGRKAGGSVGRWLRSFPVTVESLDAGALRALMGTFRDALTLHREVLNLLNVYPVPDGDTGSWTNWTNWTIHPGWERSLRPSRTVR